MRRLKATVSSVNRETVGLLLKDGRSVEIHSALLPDGLRYVGTPVSLLHDDDGFIMRVRRRRKERLPDEIRRSIEDIMQWVERL